MYQLVQDMMVIVFGLLLILLLLFTLRYVHKQAQRVKQLETELYMTETANEAELSNQTEEK